MQNQPVEYLLSQYVSGQITEKEWEELSRIMLDPENEQTIREKIAGLMLQSALDEQPENSSSENQADQMTPWRNQDTLHSMLQAIFSVDKTAGAADIVGSRQTAGSHEMIRSAEEVSPANLDRGLRGSGGRLFLLRPVFLKWSAAAVLV